MRLPASGGSGAGAGGPSVNCLHFTLRRHYDDDGHATMVSRGASVDGLPYWAVLSADEGYRVERERYGNDVVRSWNYGALTGRVESITDLGGGTPRFPRLLRIRRQW